MEYTLYKDGFKKYIGLRCLFIYERDETIDYLTPVLKYFDSYYIPLDQEIPDNIKDFITKYDEIQELIITGKFEELRNYFSVEKTETWNDRKFIMVLENFLTTVYLELLYNYPYLFTERQKDCHCSCVTSDGITYEVPETKPLGSEYVSCGCGG